MLASHSRNQLKQTFDQFDSDNNGYLSLEELTQAVQALGVNTTGDKIKKFFNDVDTDKDGQVSFQEFQAWAKVGSDSSSITFKIQKALSSATSSILENLSGADSAGVSKKPLIDVKVSDHDFVPQTELDFTARIRDTVAIESARDLENLPGFDPKHVYLYLIFYASDSAELHTAVESFVENLVAFLPELDPSFEEILAEPESKPQILNLGDRILVAMNLNENKLTKDYTSFVRDIEHLQLQGTGLEVRVNGQLAGTLSQLREENPLEVLNKGIGLHIQGIHNPTLSNQIRETIIKINREMSSGHSIIRPLELAFMAFKGLNARMRLKKVDGLVGPDDLNGIRNEFYGELKRMGNDLNSMAEQFPFVQDFLQALREHGKAQGLVGVSQELMDIELKLKAEGLGDIYDDIINA